MPLKFSALTSLEFATLLMEEAGVVAAPGSGFGEFGEKGSESFFSEERTEK